MPGIQTLRRRDLPSPDTPLPPPWTADSPQGRGLSTHDAATSWGRGLQRGGTGSRVRMVDDVTSMNELRTRWMKFLSVTRCSVLPFVCCTTTTTCKRTECCSLKLNSSISLLHLDNQLITGVKYHNQDTVEKLIPEPQEKNKSFTLAVVISDEQ